jgi:hypothetical protein
VDIKGQLNELIKVQSAMIVDCYKIIKDIKFLSTGNHPKEIADIIAGDRFFIRTGDYMWIIIVLELNKLYDKEENYALSKTLNIVINNSRSLTGGSDADFKDIIKLKAEIEGQEIKAIVDKLNYIRDKQVAHLDRNRMNKETLIYLDEAKNLVDLGQKALSEISSKINGYALGLDLDFLGLCETTITKLVNYNRIRQ